MWELWIVMWKLKAHQTELNWIQWIQWLNWKNQKEQTYKRWIVYMYIFSFFRTFNIWSANYIELFGFYYVQREKLTRIELTFVHDSIVQMNNRIAHGISIVCMFVRSFIRMYIWTWTCHWWKFHTISLPLTWLDLAWLGLAKLMIEFEFGFDFLI